MKKNIIIIGIIIAGIAGGYFLFKKFMKDRARVENYSGQADVIRRQIRQENIPQQTRVTYTKEQLEEMRKKGKLPPNLKQPYMPPATTAGQEAVQRQLHTIEEINKINEMNQRLMDQQRRMQNQK